ncbi:Serine/threonine protein kinase [Paenibacillus sp. 1_12]|uniref:protein kinase domain-containing protein n=1 Tax=Paenibacillus sp. 1_12 TaxID=1566278 RepID=UPI0008F2AFBF|nr:LuxR C-terminal-related transcriptional regulator [Paenibacillus sp. 1_12]SFM10908.1 Serine/threonine protein kinase [Paenibacillus sp. 1_12]
MITVPGYHFVHLVYEDDNIWICHAYSEHVSRIILWKMVKDGPRTMIENSKLIHEYETLALLEMEGILKPHTLLRQSGSMVLIFDIINGIVLRQYMYAGRTETLYFLKIAIKICDILVELHRHELLHLNIRPDTIILVEDKMQVCLTGFSDSVPFRQSLNATQLEGSPPYMAPERTAGSRRLLDGRTDLYSLGVTFYEMLAGELPFQAKEPLEWAHAHIAKQPPSLVDKAGVTKMLAAIVSKLLAKTPESRYNSAKGLRADLLRCLEQWEDHGELRDFELGLEDDLPWNEGVAIERRSNDLQVVKNPSVPQQMLDQVAAFSSIPIRQNGTTPFSDSGYAQMLDLTAVFKASHIFASETDGHERVRKLLLIVLEQAGASRGCWVTMEDRNFTVAHTAESAAGQGWTFESETVSLDHYCGASQEIIQSAAARKQSVYLNDATQDGPYMDTDYVKKWRPKAVICLPILIGQQLSGLLYLENHLSSGVFSLERLGVLRMLAMQVFYAKRLIAESNPRPVLFGLGLDTPASASGLLSIRELEVLQWMASGLSNREIAERLNIARETVKVHARNIYDKLAVSGRMKAVDAGRSLGLIR